MAGRWAKACSLPISQGDHAARRNGYIAAITLAADTPPYFDTTKPFAGQRPFDLGAPGVWARVADYELVCSSTNHNVPLPKTL